MMLRAAGCVWRWRQLICPFIELPVRCRGSIGAKLRIVIEFLRKSFCLRSPRILVSGLNPHAGEKGHLGLEELKS